MKTQFKTVLLGSCIACTLLFASSNAAATIYSGTVIDAANGKYPATDVLAETMSFDNATGTWRTMVTFRGKALTTTNVQIYISFDTGSLNEFGWPDRQPFYEISVRGGKMTFVDRTVAGLYGSKPKVTLSRPDKVLLAKVVSPGMIGLVPLKSGNMRLSYKTINQDFIYGFPLLPQP